MEIKPVYLAKLINNYSYRPPQYIYIYIAKIS